MSHEGIGNVEMKETYIGYARNNHILITVNMAWLTC